MSKDFLHSNSVGRLYLLLNEVRTIKVPKGTKMREVWAQIFGVAPNDVEEVFLLYVEMLRLLRDAQADLAQVPDIEQSLYLSPFPHLERAFTASSLEHPVEHFRQYLDEKTMTSLMFGAHTLDKFSAENVVEEEILKNIKTEVEALIDDILKADDIAHELRSFLIDRLEDIRRAIMYYRLNGTKGLRRALETTIGASFLLKYLELPDTDGRNRLKSFGQRFTKIVAKVAEIAFSVAVKQALEGAGLPMLPGK